MATLAVVGDLSFARASRALRALPRAHRCEALPAARRTRPGLPCFWGIFLMRLRRTPRAHRSRPSSLLLGAHFRPRSLANTRAQHTSGFWAKRSATPCCLQPPAAARLPPARCLVWCKFNVGRGVHRPLSMCNGRLLAAKPTARFFSAARLTASPSVVQTAFRPQPVKWQPPHPHSVPTQGARFARASRALRALFTLSIFPK